jgi:hypothetical protein
MSEDVNKVIEAAKALGIKLTAADLDTQACEQWADRVMNAKLLFDRGDMAEAQAMIEEANAYAV